MLISVNKLKQRYTKFLNYDNELLLNKLKAIEIAIRNHTNNKFQNKYIRIIANVENGFIKGMPLNVEAEDTIEISEGINKGLYTVKSVGSTIETNEPLYNDATMQVITKIEYPPDIIEGAIDLLDWELNQKGKEKTGIASETISRHAVSYVQRTDDNTISGYPKELFNFCKNYIKARF